eukprot:TRINITY_DN14134_c0_g1_i1.p1 TRINITY_DN14134_c0_g1~~TRINITY_DN14134_c0_g1_i1.p1  ORF type:complete len:311 (-),score=97.90 TRINITY_DN14134_c0_g1_i1:135-1067(-)
MTRGSGACPRKLFAVRRSFSSAFNFPNQPLSLSPKMSASPMFGSAATDALLNVAAFQSHLRTEQLGRCLVYRRSTPTTMAVAKHEADEGAPHGTVVFADEQTSGLASKDHRTWSSRAGGNIYTTILLRSQSFADIKRAVIATPVAIAIACKREGVDAKVKWPNDVWIGSKKLSGLILHSDFMGTEAIGRLGVGINVNEDMSTNPSAAVQLNAISVSQAAGRPIDREKFFAVFLNELEALLYNDDAGVLAEYRRLSLLTGAVTVFPNGVEHAGHPATVVGIDDNFLLRVRRPDGKEEVLSNQEVTVRPANL